MRLVSIICFLSIVLNGSAQELTEKLVKIDTINNSNWINVPHVTGRLATEDDVQKGKAIFTRLEKESYPLDMQIPSLAYLTDQRTEEKNIVVIIQAETNDGIKFTGFRILEGGGHGICLLEDLELIKCHSQE